jgi:hypothetical protein
MAPFLQDFGLDAKECPVDTFKLLYWSLDVEGNNYSSRLLYSVCINLLHVEHRLEVNVWRALTLLPILFGMY